MNWIGRAKTSAVKMTTSFIYILYTMKPPNQAIKNCSKQQLNARQLTTLFICSFSMRCFLKRFIFQAFALFLDFYGNLYISLNGTFFFRPTYSKDWR